MLAVHPTVIIKMSNLYYIIFWYTYEPKHIDNFLNCLYQTL